MPLRRPTATLLSLAAAVLVVVGCEGVDDEDAIAVADSEPSANCAAAFQDAAEPATAEGELGLEGDGTDEPDEQDAGNAATTDLLDLEPTLDSCTSVRDWLAGAREFRGAVPRSLDAESALRMLCDNVDGEPSSCVGLARVDLEP